MIWPKAAADLMERGTTGVVVRWDERVGKMEVSFKGGIWMISPDHLVRHSTYIEQSEAGIWVWPKQNKSKEKAGGKKKIWGKEEVKREEYDGDEDEQGGVRVLGARALAGPEKMTKEEAEFFRQAACNRATAAAAAARAEQSQIAAEADAEEDEEEAGTEAPTLNPFAARLDLQAYEVYQTNKTGKLGERAPPCDRGAHGNVDIVAGAYRPCLPLLLIYPCIPVAIPRWRTRRGGSRRWRRAASCRARSSRCSPRSCSRPMQRTHQRPQTRWEH